MTLNNKFYIKTISLALNCALLFTNDVQVLFANSGINQNVVGLSQGISSTDITLGSSTKFQNVEGYILAKTFKIKDRHLALYVHQKTGAQIVVTEMINEDESDNDINIFFKVPSENDKGTKHVLEHCILHNLLNRPNLCWGVASDIGIGFFVSTTSYRTCNFKNIVSFDDELSFILSQLKKPDFIDDETIFDIEAHHEHTSSSGKKFVRGSVYKEMCRFPENNNYLKNVMPNSKLKFVYGGLPDDILTLTHQEVVDTYNKYIHPSNSISYITSFNYKSIMNKLNDEYFNCYSPKNINVNYDLKSEELSSNYEWTSQKFPNYDTSINSKYIAEIFFDLKNYSAKQIDYICKACEILAANQQPLINEGYNAFEFCPNISSSNPYIKFLLYSDYDNLLQEETLINNLHEFIVNNNIRFDDWDFHNVFYYDWYRNKHLYERIHQSFALYGMPFSEKLFIFDGNCIKEIEKSDISPDEKLIFNNLIPKKIIISEIENKEFKDDTHTYCFKFNIESENEEINFVTLATLNNYILTKNLSRRGVFYESLYIDTALSNCLFTKEIKGVEDALDFFNNDLKSAISNFELTPQILNDVKLCMNNFAPLDSDKIDSLTIEQIQNSLNKVSFSSFEIVKK